MPCKYEIIYFALSNQYCQSSNQMFLCKFELYPNYNWKSMDALNIILMYIAFEHYSLTYDQVSLKPKDLLKEIAKTIELFPLMVVQLYI